MTYQRENLMNPLYDYLTNAVKKMVRNSKGVMFHENKRNALLYKFGKINGEWKYVNELDVQTDEDEIVRIIVENMMTTLESEFTFKTFLPEQEYPHLMKCGCVKAPAKKAVTHKPVWKTPAKKTPAHTLKCGCSKAPAKRGTVVQKQIRK